VAKGALDEYLEFHGAKKDNTYTLYTFVDVNRFRAAAAVSIKKGDAPLKIAAVGALRIQKNYPFLLEAFRQLKNEDFELHIFGLGPLKEELQEAISQTGVRVILKGEVKNIEQVLPEYDLFVMASTFEGFSLGVLEAMAMRMPLLLSNIPSFREQCEDTAVYFELDKPGDFAEGLKQLAADRQKMEWMGQKAYERVIENFTLEHHMKGLRKIYDNSLV
jgi:glycosyltransferase involved in cell wall biosynthesis